MIRIALVAAFALAGCVVAPYGATATELSRRPPGLPGVSYGGLGETIRVGRLTVRPLAVIEDSRCPSNVTCVWAGRVVLRLRITSLGERTISSIEPLALPGGGRLELAGVWPPRVHGERPAGPYRFGFRRR